MIRTASIPRWRGLAPLMPALAVALLLAGGCDTAIEPFEDRGLHYSIFGVLDAGADTQYVRITPLRDSIALSPGPIDAAAVLEHVASGSRIVLHDSLFFFGEGRLSYNFWTGEPLEPRASYRLTVTRADGAASTATLALPDTIPDPQLAAPVDPMTDPRDLVQSIKVGGVERLMDVRIVYTLRFPNADPGTTFRHTISYLDRSRPLADGIGVQFNAYNDLIAAFGRACPLVVDAWVYVAAPGPDWPDLEGVDLETLARPDVITNVEQGVGFVGGIASKTRPWPELIALSGARQALCVATGT